MRRPLLLLAAAASAGLMPVPAMADAIDGHWCNAAGNREMQIEGPRIVTPGGRSIDGRYGRHSFTYVVPEGEASAGSTVNLQLLRENEMRSGGEGIAPDVWHRCARTS